MSGKYVFIDGTANLDSTTEVSGGAGMVGFNATLNYVAGTIGAKLATMVSVKDFPWLAQGDGVADDAAAIQACVTACANVYFPAGTYLIGSTITVGRQGQHLYGAGYTVNGTILQRSTDSGFGPLIDVPLGSTGCTVENMKFQEADYTGAFTNTSPLLRLADNDHTIDRVWFYAGYNHIKGEPGTGDVTITNSIFENSRKDTIWGESVGLWVLGENKYYKCTTSTSDPVDRGAVLKFTKASGYTYGSHNIVIDGNWFREAVYGAFIHLEDCESITINGNALSIPSQIDSGQRDDIYLKNTTNVVINGNSSNNYINSYVLGQRGARYVVNIDTGCSNINVGPNSFVPGVSGTVNDPNGSVTILLDKNSGLRLPNVASADPKVMDYYLEGTWTPTVDFGGAHTGQTYTTQTGRYVRMGGVAILECAITVSAKGSSTGVAAIAGLPFALGSTPVGWIVASDAGITLTGQLLAHNAGGSSTLRLYPQNNGATGAQLTDAAFAGSFTIRFSIACVL